MTQVITIRPLTDGETIAVFKLPKFNFLKPVKCEDCKHGTDFTRKIFLIGGVKKDERCDDGVQNIICSYLRKSYGIAYVFFKSPNEKFYADSACCPKCQSTRIIFDIELTDDFFRQTSKIAGISIEKHLIGVKETAKHIAYTGTKDAHHDTKD